MKAKFSKFLKLFSITSSGKRHVVISYFFLIFGSPPLKNPFLKFLSYVDGVTSTAPLISFRPTASSVDALPELEEKRLRG